MPRIIIIILMRPRFYINWAYISIGDELGLTPQLHYH